MIPKIIEAIGPLMVSSQISLGFSLLNHRIAMPEISERTDGRGISMAQPKVTCYPTISIMIRFESDLISSLYLNTISGQTLRVCPEGKPVPTLR